MYISDLYFALYDWKKEKGKITENESFLKCIRQTSHHTTDCIYSKHELIFMYLFILLAQRILEWNEDPKGLKRFCKIQTVTLQPPAKLNSETLIKGAVIYNI